MEERTTPRRRPQSAAVPRPAAVQTGTPPVRRRRKPRKPPVKALAICAAVIFALGFLMGFLVRGFFIPKDETPTVPVAQQTPQDTVPPAESQSPVVTDPPRPAPDWRLLLVNADNPLPENYKAELTRLSGGAEVDKRCYSDLQSLLAACKAAGFSPTIIHGHILPGQTADAEAALPACEAEHGTGLAIDIVDASSQSLDESQRGTEIGAWLAENAWQYGFLQRYPEAAAAETGVAFAPWHYRYVGVENAQAIHEAGLTLEGYLLATAG